MGETRILHFLTPLANPSPFDVNMAVDAGFTIAAYTKVGLDDVTGLTQDAMFSRAPQDAAKTCLFLGGRDGMLALDMLARAKAAMFPPFLISVFADPSGAFTTAAAMIACVERRLRAGGHRLAGAKVAVFGAKGAVGGIAGLIAAEAGAEVTLVAHDASGIVPAKAADYEARFKRSFKVADGSAEAGRRAALADCDIVLAAGRAGLRILTRSHLGHAKRLKVAADINAVPPSGIEGVEVQADGAALDGTPGVAIGALAIGNVKFQVQHALLQQLHRADQARFLDFRDAYRVALDLAK